MLEELDLARNRLAEIPAWIGELTRLRSLDLSGCPIPVAPRELGQLTHLRFLDLSDTPVSDLPDAFALPASLEELRLERTAIPEERLAALRQRLPNTRVLASPRRIRKLEEALSAPGKPVSLDLSSQDLVSLPAEIGRLEGLRTLRLSNNRLKAVPVALTLLPQLRELWLDGNRISELVRWPCAGASLEHLILDNNGLRSLPRTIADCAALRTLSLRRNRLRELPADMDALKQLRSLALDENDFTREEFNALAARLPRVALGEYRPRTFLSLEEALTEPDRVAVLDLSRKGLAILDPAIGRLVNLERLYLRENRLSALPAEIKALAKLRYLDIAENPLTGPTLANLRRWLPKAEIESGN
jgi:Leucine-rich repeat (LRR) protein